MPKKQIPEKAKAEPKVTKNIQKKAKGHFDLKKVKAGEYFSGCQYLKVLKTGNNVSLQTETGKVIEIEKSILVEDSYSADHYDREVNCNMTELVEVLESASDTIFKVQFKKKVDEKTILQKLETIGSGDAKKLTKELLDGETCTLVAHLAKTDNYTGRTLVIELESNGFR